ncbi:isoprenylcysteine carboxylmethyltransferase family protein [Paraburkholderia sp. Ac-20336]|uniref:isoprenylcysteine carboxylmethyltransferase family protein n=1 Tax=Paraburkholderia sp. Ac-20336 TaxID=2703886 RepID=UPI001F1212E1|nr:isoprenylcysteine carboxylmethyltransferase family protein [Paraburkholderia sp. Ac-20336]
MLDVVLPTRTVNDVREGRAVSSAICELNAVMGQCGMVPARNGPDEIFWYRTRPVVVAVLRIQAIASRRRMFAYNVAIRDKHELVISDLYHLANHPSYACMFITLAGYGLALNNGIGFAIEFVPVFAVVKKRIAIEESVLLKRLAIRMLHMRGSASEL